mmetsp:Transcript_9886/g.18982  ORF Transcript_9886/g.18982 Transcript_9886/m.18982 type:complete len:138 (-) Transcript_9886:104-517(-)
MGHPRRPLVQSGNAQNLNEPDVLSQGRLTRRREKRKSREYAGESVSKTLPLHQGSSSSSNSGRNRAPSVAINLIEESDESKDRKRLLEAASKEARRRPLWKNMLMDKNSAGGRTQKETARGKRGRAAIAAVLAASKK